MLAAKPNQSQDIAYIGNYIRSDRAQWATNTLRSMLTTATKDELGDFKKLYFETATFNGIFSYRSARNLVVRSPFLVLDIDDLESTDEARYVQSQLVSDQVVETALCFVSPKGRGVKWVVRLPDWAQSPDFKPAITLDPQVIRNFFEKQAPPVNMFTNDSPDELKPVIPLNP